MLAANAYLGCWGIVACLRAGADVVVTGRVTDASLLVGPAAWHHGWAADDWDALAGATVAGHVLECGAQATGGNYSFFRELDLRRPGFPLAEVHADGSSVITKHPGTGGAVTVDTVTAQLLYEIDGADYLGPDVRTRFDTVRLAADGPDRVRVTGVAGAPPPRDGQGGRGAAGRPPQRDHLRPHRTGRSRRRRPWSAAQVEDALGAARPERLVWTLARTDHADADTEEAASALLHVVAQDPDPAKVGRAFSRVPIELALASYPGFHVTAPPGDGTPYGTFTPRFVDRREVEHVAVLPDGRRVPVPEPSTADCRPGPEPAVPPPGRRADPAGAARDGRRGPLRRQGRPGQHRRLGPHRRRVPWLVAPPHHRPAGRAAAGGRRAPDRPGPCCRTCGR